MATTMTKKMTTGNLPDHYYLKSQVDEYVDMTQDGRALSEKCRDYVDSKQWTSEQVEALRKRKQAPIVNNRIKVKQNGLLGLISMRKGDPQAFPRNVDNDSKASEATTDGLRYVADQQRLNSKFLAAADNFFCEGYCAINVTTDEGADGEIDVVVDHIEWDRIFFDPYSRKHDFSDCRYKGYMMWMDEDDIEHAFPDADEDALTTSAELGQEGWAFDDKPRWTVSKNNRKRHLVATHYFKYKDVWYITIYTGGGFLLEPMESPWLDEYGKTMCPIEIEHAYIDRDNNRYGEIAAFLDLQDEINHRRSKALFLLSQRQTYANRGAVKDIAKAKRELSKADGHLEVQQGEFGKDFGILPTGDMAQGQFELLQEAKQEMDAQSYNAQLAGERGSGDLSGKAIGKLQQAGVVELNRLFDNFSAYKLRVYRQIWCRIRQAWTREKWVRVTDDDKKPRWVGFNVELTMGEYLQEIMDDESKPYEMRLGASATMIQLEQQNPEGLKEVVEVQNRPSELDMDLILEESYDFLNNSEEQMTAIMNYGAAGQFDIIDLLEISNVNGKEKLIEKLTQRRKEASEAAAQQGPDPQAQYLQAKANESAAAAEQKLASAEHQKLETEILATTPQLPYKTSVSI